MGNSFCLMNLMKGLPTDGNRINTNLLVDIKGVLLCLAKVETWLEANSRLLKVY
jgi:hypothetical protein